MAGMTLNQTQIAGLVSDLANNSTLIAAVAAALANTNANVATVSGNLATTATTINANVSTVSNTVSFINGGFETVTNVAIQANGAVYLDLANATAFELLFNKNITGFYYLNPPANGTRKAWTLTLKSVGQANTVTYGSNVVHSGGSAPSINTTNGKRNVITQFTDNASVTVYNVKSGEF